MRHAPAADGLREADGEAGGADVEGKGVAIGRREQHLVLQGPIGVCQLALRHLAEEVGGGGGAAEEAHVPPHAWRTPRGSGQVSFHPFSALPKHQHPNTIKP